MDIIIGCEESGVVRDAFASLGHNAVSCDLLPTRRQGSHIQGDILNALESKRWDMGIFFPPCTHLCVSGARWWVAKAQEQQEAIQFFLRLWESDIDKVCIENPVGIMSSKLRKPDQIIQPWQFGHGETKATCLWLRGLSKLEPTNIVDGRVARIHRMPPGPNRARDRSETYCGIARAMAEQWGQ